MKNSEFPAEVLETRVSEAVYGDWGRGALDDGTAAGYRREQGHALSASTGVAYNHLRRGQTTHRGGFTMTDNNVWLGGLRPALLVLGALAMSGCNMGPADAEGEPLAQDEAELCYQCDPRPEEDPIPPEPKPDLRPINSSAGNPYCVISWANNQPMLGVLVKNVGDATAPASTTRVRFTWATGSQESLEATPSLAPGGTRYHWVYIPQGCWDPDCNFQYDADSGNVVAESSETNNSATGFCTFN